MFPAHDLPIIQWVTSLGVGGGNCYTIYIEKVEVVYKIQIIYRRKSTILNY